ncbi:MAG: ABC transporter ATP-binding protein [Actinomycetota bacterium]|nr:ABC transporter ATP-binding protein [Actinomycetota bacterium]
MRTNALLWTQDLTKHYGGITALDGVEVAVRPGEIVGILGPNGAGKTTLFDAITGFVRPDWGRVVLAGESIGHLFPYERVAAGVGRTFQHVRLFGRLTVFENLLVAQHRRGRAGSFAAMLRLPSHRREERAAAERAEELLDLIDLRAWRNAHPTELSYGTLRFLELACALSLRPSVLLLDEPASGIAQREVEALGPLLKRIRDEEGCALLLIEHDMRLLLSVSDWVYAMDLGSVIAEGRPDDVVADDRVLESYLGRTRSEAHAPA